MNIEELIRTSVEVHTDVAAPPVDPAGLALRARRRRALTVAGVGGAVVAVVAASVVGVSAISHDASRAPTTRPTNGDPASGSPSAGETELFMRATVLESPEHGPQLCVNVDDSFPPQCGGADINGWDWGVVADEEHSGGTTWGDYIVFGLYDADTLAVTRDAVPVHTYTGPPLLGPPDPYSTQCPEPPGGWADVDPATSTNAALHQAYTVAEHLDGYATAFADPHPQYTILNVLVTGDLGAAEQALRGVWGGPLCVGAAAQSAAELAQIQQEVDSAPGFTGSSIAADEVTLWVYYDDGTLQNQYDDAYGAGAVVVYSLLQPYPGA